MAKPKPILKVFYDPIRKDWNEKIKAELRRRGLSVADLKKYTVFAIPEKSQDAPLYQELN